MDQLEIKLGRVTVRADLLAAEAPRTVKALKTALPQQGTALHSRWSGPCFYLVLKQTALNQAAAALENRVHLMPPGSVVWSPELAELFVVYDDARLYNGAAGGLYGSMAAQIRGDLRELGKEAFSLREDGAKPVSFTLVDG